MKILISSQAMQVWSATKKAPTLPNSDREKEMPARWGGPKNPHGRPDPRGSLELGTVVLGTVRGDIHDIGKDIVASCWR